MLEFHSRASVENPKIVLVLLLVLVLDFRANQGWFDYENEDDSPAQAS